jgi:hypothetical protein
MQLYRSMPEDLPQGYYLENFNYLFDFVGSHYADILNEREKNYLTGFRDLSDDAQKLYVRLAGRRGPWFRLDKLSYVEIPDIASAVAELISASYLSSVKSLQEPQNLLKLMTKSELVVWFEGADKRLSRQALDQWLVEKHAPEDLIGMVPFQIVEPIGLDILQILKLLFFGNLYQDFTQFVLRDLGITPYEKYRFDSAGRFFDVRSILDTTIEQYALNDTVMELIELGDAQTLRQWLPSMLQLGFDEPTILRRHHRLLNRIAREFERFNDINFAQHIYLHSSLEPSRERQVRIMTKQGEITPALKLCEDIHQNPQSEAEFEFAQTFATRLARQHKISCDWLPSSAPAPIVNFDVSVQPDVNRRVEILAQDWFVQQGSQAYYVENALLPGLFGLYFWDVIFAEIKGVFFNPFQRGPSDLFTPSFVERRQEKINAKLMLMTDKANEQEVNLCITDCFSRKFGLANHFVNWSWLTADLIELALLRIPKADLASIFARLLSDLKNNRSGFPDLIVFPDGGGYELVEVKGPGDKLQQNQIRWFNYFQQQDLPARVISVAWQQKDTLEDGKIQDDEKIQAEPGAKAGSAIGGGRVE